jgi:hypothetical protein
MAFPGNQWYVNSVGYAAITAWAALTAQAAGVLRRQLAAPAVGSERIFVCIIAGTTLASEPTWVITRGGKTAEAAGPTWQECTGQAGVNGDLTNCPNWTAAKVVNAVTLGTIIKNNAATHLFILSTSSGNLSASQPSFNTTTGATTADASNVWTCIGAVGSFTGGLAPHARILNAMTSTWQAAGDKICVGDNHAESQSTAQTITGLGTSSNPNIILCHNHSGNYPPTSSDLTTGATVTGSGNNSLIPAGFSEWNGITFINSAATGTIGLGNNGVLSKFKNCSFQLSNNSATARFVLASQSNSGAVITDNCTFSFANASQVIQHGLTVWRWYNTASAILGTVPTVLFSTTTGEISDVQISGVDLSALGSGKTIFGNVATLAGTFSLIGCKLGASVAVSATITSPNYRIFLVDCDSGNTNYRNEIYDFRGALTTETTIVRTGGENDGTTALSRKMVSTANTNWSFPFDGFVIEQWVNGGSQVTLTLFGIWGGGAVPNNDDFWIDVDYQSSGSTPLYSRVTSTKANILASNSPLSTDTSVWGGSTTPFKTSVVFTPLQNGYVYIYPRLGDATTTLYYDTKVTVV